MKSYKGAFISLFEKALKVREEDQVTIIYDEALESIFPDMVKAVNAIGVSTTFIYLPQSYQRALIKQDNGTIREVGSAMALPRGLATAITESSVTLNVLNNDPATTNVRVAILQETSLSQKGARYAHCPGFSADVLKIIDKTPFDEIYEHSELTAWALGEAQHADLKTYSKNGKEYSLRMELGGWENQPMIDSGIINDGSWGNLPPGETFCCPKSETVEGAICINGSLIGIVLKAKEEVVLHFEKGKLVKWESKYPPCNAFFEKLHREARKNRDPNWNSFAELGIGLNPVIKRLKGIPLFDEKMAGTVHIAIGANYPFGHDIKSSIHIDMVTKKPSLYLDGHAFMEHGEMRVQETQKRRKDFKPEELDIDPERVVIIDKAKLHIDNCVLKRRLASARRIGFVDIVEKMNDEFCKKIEQATGDTFKCYSKDLLDLASNEKERDRVSKLIRLLHHYNIIRFGGKI